MSFLEEILEQLKKDGHFDKPDPKINMSREQSSILAVIEEHGLNFNLGTAVGQILSTNLDCCEIDRLKVAAWYIQREIERLEKD